MKCWSGRLLATLLGFVSLGSTARADIITPWTFSWSSNPTPSVAADLPFGTGGINLLPSSSAVGTHVTGDSDINAVNLKTFSSATTTADTFTNALFSLTLHLTDSNSSQSGDLTFNSEFNGTLTTTNAQITNTFLSPTTQNIVLGQNTYTVALNSYVAPDDPNSTLFGSIGAHVSIAGDLGSGGGNGDGGGGGGVVSIQDVPEPSSLLLAGLTLPAAGLTWWRARALRSRRPEDDLDTVDD